MTAGTTTSTTRSAPPRKPEPPRAPERLRPVLASAFAIAAFFAAAACVLSSVWRAGVFDAIPVTTRDPVGTELDETWRIANVGDTTFVAALTARNAYTLSHSPRRLFDAEHCAPARRTLAYGEPLLTVGAVAVPALLVTGDPIAAYNCAVLALLFLAAAAMYVLVSDWTGSRAAGATAAVVYAFASERIFGITHAFLFDTSWLLFGLYFGRRLLAQGKWRDAAGLAACAAMQLGTSSYAVLASLLFATPVIVCLIAKHGLRTVRIGQLAFVFTVLLAAVYAIFSPYLEVRAATGTFGRPLQHFTHWSWYLPWHETRITWTAALLAVIALTARRGRVDVAGGAAMRWCIAAGALLAAAAAAGGNPPASWVALWGGEPPAFPNVFAALAAVLPGLDAVRVPARIDTGYHLGVCLLAGYGAASLRERAVRRRAALATALVGAAAFEAIVLIFGWPPMQSPFGVVQVAAARDAAALIRAVAGPDRSGAVLDLPLGTPDRDYVFQAPPRILASAYHHRRTSACYGSFFPPGREALRTDALALPDAAALGRICAQGFTTAVVHLNSAAALQQAERLRAAGQDASSGIRPLGSAASMTAFSLCERGSAAAAEGTPDRAL